jgi:hypothetical protein
LLSIYQRDDLAAAIERCSRYRAFSLTVVERILAAQARPRSSLELLDSEARTYLGRLSDDEPVNAIDHFPLTLQAGRCRDLVTVAQNRPRPFLPGEHAFQLLMADLTPAMPESFGQDLIIAGH